MVNFGNFPLNSAPRNKKLRVKCPLCGNGVSIGYVSEPYEDTVQRQDDDVAVSGRRSSRSEPNNRLGSARGGGSGARDLGRSSNDSRSNSLNPNNSAHRSASNNRSNQMNPNNPSFRSSRGKR